MPCQKQNPRTTVQQLYLLLLMTRCPLLYSPHHGNRIVPAGTKLPTAIGGGELIGNGAIGIVNILDHMVPVAPDAKRRAPWIHFQRKSRCHNPDDTRNGVNNKGANLNHPKGGTYRAADASVREYCRPIRLVHRQNR